MKTSDDYGASDAVDRSKSPLRFWVLVLIQLGLGAILALGVIKVP